MEKLWIIDDDDSVRKVLNMVFSRDFRVSVFSDGEDALESLVAGNIPDAILSDLWNDKGGMHGHEFYREAYRMLPENTPRYLMTGRIHDVPLVIPDVHALGITKVVGKPFDFLEMRTSLKYDIRAAQAKSMEAQNPNSSV